jgi:hypothetical protein
MVGESYRMTISIVVLSICVVWLEILVRARDKEVPILVVLVVLRE